MIDLIERIGPVVGIVAFLGLAILAFLIFQQAREVRRLREWAGRAPERANEAAEAAAAAAEARGEAPATAEEPEEPELAPAPTGRLALFWEGLRDRFAPAWDAVDRRSPVDPRYLVAVLAAAVVAAAVLTSGFGLIGGDETSGGSGGGGKGAKAEKEEKVEVAVVNATQIIDPDTGVEIEGVAELASTVADDIVKPADFKPGVETNAPEGFEETVVMFDGGNNDEEAANQLAAAVEADLGQTPVEPMSDDIVEVAEGAPLALVVGQDDAESFD
jgi:hypothetical protein